jgi:hypothetical protein
MSAFLCNPHHIAILAKFLAGETKHFGNAPSIATSLAEENLKSVEYNYAETVGHSAREFLDMSNAQYLFKCRVLTQSPNLPLPPPARVFGMVRCYTYQAGDHETWSQSHAYQCAAYILDVAAKQALDELGVETGWVFDPDSELAVA